MDMVPDNETEGFSFIWTIQNFSYCLQQKGEPLVSPNFKLNLSDTIEWYLKIYPKGCGKEDTIGVFLNIEYDCQFPVKLERHVSIRSTNGIFKRKRDECATITFSCISGIGYDSFLNYRTLFKNNEFLKNDTLTLRCRIWKYSELPVTGLCYARSIIDVKRKNFVWEVSDFEELLLKKRETYYFHEPSSESFSMEILVSGPVNSERKIQVEIKLTDPLSDEYLLTSQMKFMTCKLSLLDVDGRAEHPVQDDHMFEDTPQTEIWHFTYIPVKKILDHDKVYLVNGTLSLRCEFAASSGTKYSEIERIEYGVVKEDDPAWYNKRMDLNGRFPVGSLNDNLQRFYKESKLSDSTIRTASGKSFPAHKAILCARSEVFRAMFEHDTKENRTNVVEIEDLNDDTVSKMLLFFYTDIVEDLQWAGALELYLAADKYGIVALKTECSIFLQDNLNSSNVCDVLVLADMHQDKDMKSTAQDFIMDNATEVINSENWKKFIQEKSNFAAETLQVLFMRNLKN